MADFGNPDSFSKDRRFDVKPSPGACAPFQVVSGGMERCNGNYHVARADSPCFSLEYVFRGQGKFRARERTYSLTAGSLFICSPRLEHEIIADGKKPLVKYFLDFSGNQAGDMFRTSPFRIGTVVQTTAPGHLRRIFEDLIDAGLRQSPFQGEICAVIAKHLLWRVAETSTAFTSRKSTVVETYEFCRRYIEEHYRTINSLSELGVKCELDPSYLCRVFQRYEGQSPWKLILQLRMRDAAERLQVPGISVTAVAAELGFGRVFQFSRTFRRFFGVSPRQFACAQEEKSACPSPGNRIPTAVFS